MNAPTDARIAISIAHAAEVMRHASTVDEVLDLIVRGAATTLPSFDHIGISTARKRVGITNRGATSDLVHELDQLQYSLPEGPCFDTLQGEAVVVAPTIRHDQRWPRYVPRAVERGLLSQVAVRLDLVDQGITGSLNLYSTQAEEISDDDVLTATAFATHASIALGRAVETSALTTAVQTRQTMGQAIGILMERYRIDEQAAHAFLWRASSHANVKVRDIAVQLIEEAGSHRPQD